MKVTINQYAKSLYEITEGKSPKEINGLVSNLVKILAKNRQIKLANKISEKFGEIWNKENGVVEAMIITHQKLERQNVKKIEEFIGKKYQAKKVVLKNNTDEKIKGGIIIQVGDEVLDGSIIRQLQNLRENLER